MLLHNGGGNGQADAEAALLFLVPGGIGAVEAVEQLPALFVGQRLGEPRWIPSVRGGVPPPGFSDDVPSAGAYLTALSSSVDSIRWMDARSPRRVRSFSPPFPGFSPDTPPWPRRAPPFPEAGRPGTGLHGQRRVLLLHAGQVNQLLHQVPHLGRLLERAPDPRVVGHVRVQQLHVGGDHRQRGFQLMAGVGDELLLLLHAADDRLDGLPAGQRHKQPGQQDAAQTCERRRSGPACGQRSVWFHSSEQHRLPAPWHRRLTHGK